MSKNAAKHKVKERELDLSYIHLHQRLKGSILGSDPSSIQV